MSENLTGLNQMLMDQWKSEFESHLLSYEVAKSISDLEDKLRNHDGQLVLLNKILHKSKYVGGFVGSFSIKNKSVETGLIIPPYLKINERYDYGIELTVNQKISLAQFETRPVSLEEGHILIKINDFINRKSQDWIGNEINVSTKTFQLYVGNEEVKKFIYGKYLRNANDVYQNVNDLLKNPTRLQEIKDYEIKKQKNIL